MKPVQNSRSKSSLLRDVATLTIDTSGDGLHKRGYREFAGPAPLRETMAAGLLQLSYWNRDRQFIDPFCGSGTLPIEAALIGRNIAPGSGRSFIAEDWPWMDRKMWKDVRTEAKDLRQPRMSEPILGFDHDPAAMRLSEKSAAEAGVSGDIQFRIQEISELKSSREYGVIVCNPPYGERMGSAGRSGSRLSRTRPSLRFAADVEFLRHHVEHLVRKTLRSPCSASQKTLQWTDWNVSSISTWARLRSATKTDA